MHATKRHIVLLLLLCATVCKAQDIHFSQIDQLPILYNQAYSGFFDGTGRFGIIYRNQWLTVHNPFQTIAATVEVPVYQDKYHRGGFAVGGFLYADKAGTLSYGTLSAAVILSYYKALSTRSDNLLSFAVSAAYNRSGFDPTNAEMEDPTEAFEIEKVNYPTFGAGIAWFSQASPDFSMKLGLSAHNVNNPKISYTNSGARLSPRVNGYFRGDYRFHPQWSFMPIVAVQWQKQYLEPVGGFDFKYYADATPRRYLAFAAGVNYRWADAVVFDFSTEINALTLFLSYDANLSRLRPASHTVGAFEVGMVYRLVRKRNKYKPLPCPII
ncbi:MAG: PorP/SprF family type IX secretion system membrane protein [Bacteroidales bacterium]|nr:PorP/SprF family type IX secretion system membrane protein [Bacteroidales bacterium]